MKGNIIEQIKNCMMMLLFICMIILAASFITQTQRLTLAPPKDISLDSLLVLKTGRNININYNQELMYPAFIGYKTKNIVPRGYINNDMIENIYPTLSQYIVNMLDSSSECVMITENSDEYWNECLKRDMYVYIKYHAEIPNIMLYAYLKDDYLIDNTKIAAGGMIKIKELILLLEFNDAYTYRYDMVVRDTNGNVALFKSLDQTEELEFNVDIFSMRLNTNYVNYRFAGDFDYDYENIKLNNSIVLYISDMSVDEITIDKSFDLNRSDEIAEIFDFRTDLSYEENNGQTHVYIDSYGTLKITSDGNINYKFQDNYIYIYDFLNYNKNNNNYSIYEVILAVNNFIKEIQSENIVTFGDIHTVGDDIIIEYYYIYENILLVDENYKPLTAYKFVIHNNYFKEININILEIDQKGKRINLLTDKVLPVYDSLLENEIISGIELAYIIGDPDSVVLPDYILYYGEGEN